MAHLGLLGSQSLSCRIKLVVKNSDTSIIICDSFRCAMQDVWLQWIAFMPDLDGGEQYRSKNAKPEGCYLLTRKACKVRAVQRYIPDTKFLTSGYFFFVKIPQLCKLLVSMEWHHYVFYPMTDEKKLPNFLKLEPIVLTMLFVLNRHGYLQHSAAK